MATVAVAVPVVPVALPIAVAIPAPPPVMSHLVAFARRIGQLFRRPTRDEQLGQLAASCLADADSWSE